MSRWRDSALAALLLASLLVPADAEAGLDQVVGATVRANYEAIQACYRRAVLSRDRGRGGTLFVRVTLGPNDTVRTALAARDELKSPLLASCVLGWVRGWTLRGAAAAGAGPGSEVVLPLTFRALPEQVAVREEDAEEVQAPATGRAHWRLLLTEKNSGAGSATLRLLSLDGKLALGGEERDQALYLLEGQASLAVSGPRRRVHRLVTGAAVWIPGGARAELTGKLRALQLLLASGASAAGEGVVVAPPRRARRHLGGKLRVTALLDRARLGHRRLYLGLLVADPGCRLPETEHAAAAELSFLRLGRARLSLRGARAQTLEVGAATAFHLAPGVRRQLEVLERIEAVQIFAPGGPEDELAGVRRGAR
jgi:quercetin dioxygenase-like cupin family protein